MGLFDFFRKQSTEEENLKKLASSLDKLNEVCKKETGASLALFECPNQCIVKRDGKEGVYVQMGPANKSYSCPMCGRPMKLKR